MSIVSVLTSDEVKRLEERAKVQAVARIMAQLPQIEIPVFHHFLPGLYVREIHVPRDAVTVGKIHKYGCLNLLTKGERTTLINGQMVRIKAPHFHWTGPGHQRLSFTHEDSVWITLHPTDETDIEKLEDELVAESEEEYRDFIRLLTMEAPPCLS